jgi:flagellar hook-length control protein FliK
MTPRSVASVSKTIAPPPAAAPPPPSAIDFSQFFGMGVFAQFQATNGNGSSSSDESSGPPPKLKTHDDDSDASTATAGAQTAPTQPQTAPATKSGESQTAAASATAQSAAPVLPLLPVDDTGATAPSSGANTESGGPGQSATLPPGAAALQARITVGAPGYLSQPNAYLGGLWHHDAAAVNDTSQADPASSDAADPSDAAAPGDAASILKSSASPAAILDPSHAPSARDDADAVLAVATVPGADAAVASAANAAATTVSVPVSGDAQTAAAVQTGANPTPTMPAQVLPAYEQVAVNLKQAAQSGTGSIEIQLKPASLGAIQVKLDVTHDGHITAVISADRSDTLNLLRQDSQSLQQALRDAGLKTDSGSLSFNLRGDAQSFAQNAAPTQSAPAYDDRSPSSTAPADAPSSRYRRHDGALDIEV